MNDIEAPYWAHLAGIIEGEGCFTISRNQGKAYCRLSICQHKRAQLLRPLQEIFGGKIYTQEKSKEVLSWSGHEAAFIAENILPYMLGHKTEQAELCMDYASMMPGPGHKWDRKWREWAYQEMKDLKR